MPQEYYTRQLWHDTYQKRIFLKNSSFPETHHLLQSRVSRHVNILRSALKCLIYKRSITTTTRLCSSNNYNSFISRSISSKESNSSRQNASSSNRVQEQINHGNHSTYRHRHSPRIIRHHNGRREGNSQTQVNANGRDDSSNRFNLQKSSIRDLNQLKMH